MTVLDSAPGPTTPGLAGVAPTRSAVARKGLSSPWASIAALVIAVLWTIPTFGLFLSSFRPERDVKRSGWWTFLANPDLTLENYTDVLLGGSQPLGGFVVNSILITIPSVAIPIILATLAAYGFAWTRFPLRDTLFVAIFALQIVPLQVALLPLLEIFVGTGLNGTFWTVWIAHSTFALPLAIFLLHNAMRDIPAELVEAARVDGAGHVRIFTTIMLPLLKPAIAAFAVFQFLWVWNDLLVALVFAGGTADVAPLTVRVAELAGSRDSDWHLLAAGAFVSIVIPLAVFFALQRYFVRGLLAGSVKG
ncbi:carbohydrate ABC transporter permease [Pseudonocardia kunmingensis]|uniref:Carbohydrate ABC transporter membrane protein 2 (CUT1 family) n=1 Tax=Pseudonocardia kunmingensis TaxID=630975 RepID=A0A543DAW7_9PSEU|nr:carbohydrate ABC transporter permease [Pseudonocardia kunmingensis]TQM06470.1 carbohydrate ABC transporter membrane protein 2 (CUT1 family) [Pseudonocardia kunmingensis]